MNNQLFSTFTAQLKQHFETKPIREHSTFIVGNIEESDLQDLLEMANSAFSPFGMIAKPNNERTGFQTVKVGSIGDEFISARLGFDKSIFRDFPCAERVCKYIYKVLQSPEQYSARMPYLEPSLLEPYRQARVMSWKKVEERFAKDRDSIDLETLSRLNTALVVGKYLRCKQGQVRERRIKQGRRKPQQYFMVTELAHNFFSNYF